MAPAGTIRGDYGYDSAYLANMERRPIDNLIHASGNPEEAVYEVNIRFPEL
jgi:nucleoside-diphosphate kinase